MNDEPPEPVSPVDIVIDALGKRLVPVADRFRLGKALDQANAPRPGRPGQDEALGGAIGRVKR